MMKYIRTKSEIIYVGDLIKDERGNYCDTKNYETDMEVSNEYIIKEADTIEELCDEFVIEKKGYVPFVSQTIFYNGKEHKEDLKALAEYYSGYDNIYGAIWTNKGLIYVAKMNNKGTLELI